MTPRLWSEAEVAQILRVSTETLRQWRRKKLIAHVRIGRSPMFREEHVEAFIAAREVAAKVTAFVPRTVQR